LYAVAENLLNRNFTPESTGKVWVSDLTYIRTTQGWLYLTVIVDLANRKVVGALSPTMKTSHTVIAAWKMAITNRLITTDLTFHSERGVQANPISSHHQVCMLVVNLEMYSKPNCWWSKV
jgi:transposase InsO family protein